MQGMEADIIEVHPAKAALLTNDEALHGLAMELDRQLLNHPLSRAQRMLQATARQKKVSQVEYFRILEIYNEVMNDAERD